MDHNMLRHAGVDFVPTSHHDTYPAVDPSKANMNGKVVLVTGASKGIGKALALSLVQAGVSGLALLARSDLTAVKAACEAAQRPGQSLKVLTIAADCTRTADIIAAAKQVKDTFGKLDILINSAGYMEEVTTILDSDPEDWWKSWEVNVRGTYEVVRAFLPLLIESGGDKIIVNMTSVAAHFPNGLSAGYKMNKLAVLRFTELIMAEYGDKGVLAFAVQPGAIPTDMGNKLPEGLKFFLVDKVEIAAHGITWLVRERREWLAGRYFSCLWDVDELEAKRQEIVEGDKLKVRMVV
ncbi:putative oxidoreductase [Daedalea quercina L-15889]|uniref:Putative oxidoreductase n=1 Tax=Daedalea quercina L-15889 TaxID=1314783 RepID=A0A165QGW5_9APHY|nr:putative oxidoreductase [Daedalea quercina L-15889]